MKIVACLVLGLMLAQEQEPRKAQDLLKQALKKAQEEKRSVLLTFGAPG